ncbi:MULTISPECIES: hypothetical protein [unclassified Sphingomonas]|uniref:hypothetical protein n=1 Tax=unclassified Sphingomonas TaxID=196159 RepID=UPI000BDA39AE|nr:MAG: hypothetical protein B7Y98_00195 [Sphingomonas sp. 32-62-10]
MKKLFLAGLLCCSLEYLPASAQNTPPKQTAPSTPSAPVALRHLVVLNKQGPNFALASKHRTEMLAHRQIYLDLTKSGEIIASGLLGSSPRVGFVLFRTDVDEQAIRSRLNDDFAIRNGILELEFLYWDIQMGAVGRPDTDTQ